MIAGIRGKIEKKELTKVYIDCSGIIYEVFISINCSQALKDGEIKLLITEIIREDNWSLYGFLDSSEKIMFDTLIKINGVGAKVGMAICSTFTPATFAKIVESKDAKALQRVPGIGPKSAGRIMVELAGFTLELGEKESKEGSANHEAYLALESLGFKGDIINKVLKLCTAQSTSDIVKEALKRLQSQR